MAAATQLAMSASSFFCPTSISSRQPGPTNTSQSSATLVVCQHDSSTERQTINVSRRLFAVAAASATGLGVFLQPDVAQARRTKPEETKKAEEPENKDLSAYDARVLANAKRKEAMKASVEAAKLKAKSVASSVSDVVTDIVTNVAAE